jgi:hypothetical protein
MGGPKVIAQNPRNKGVGGTREYPRGSDPRCDVCDDSCQ